MSTVMLPHVLGQLVNAFTFENKTMLDRDPSTAITMWVGHGPAPINVNIATIDQTGNTNPLNIHPTNVRPIIDSLLEMVTDDNIVNMQLRPIPILIIPATTNLPVDIEIMADTINAVTIAKIITNKNKIIEIFHQATMFRVDISINDAMRNALAIRFNTYRQQPLDLSAFMPRQSPNDYSRAVPTARGSADMMNQPSFVGFKPSQHRFQSEHPREKIYRYDNSNLTNTNPFEDFKTLVMVNLPLASDHLACRGDIPNGLLMRSVDRLQNLNNHVGCIPKIEYVLRGYYNRNATADDAFRASIAIIQTMKDLILSEESQSLLNRHPGFNYTMQSAMTQQRQESFNDAVFKTLPRAAQQFIDQGDPEELITQCLNRIETREDLPEIDQILTTYAAKGFPEAHVVPACQEILQIAKHRLLAETQQILSSKQSVNYETGNTSMNTNFMEQQHTRQMNLSEQVMDENYKNSFDVSQMHSQILHGGKPSPTNEPLDEELLEAINSATTYTEYAKHTKLEDLPVVDQLEDLQLNPEMANHLKEVEQFKVEARAKEMLTEAGADDLVSIFSQTEGELEDVINKPEKANMDLLMARAFGKVQSLGELAEEALANAQDLIIFASPEEFEKHKSRYTDHKACVVKEDEGIIQHWIYRLKPNNAFEGEWVVDTYCQIVSPDDIVENTEIEEASESIDEHFSDLFDDSEEDK